MNNIFYNYLQSVSAKFKHKETSELGYRTEFENLLKGIFETIKDTRINHDSRAVDGNKPDFIVIKYDVPLLYIETKDIGVSLDKIEKSEQMARYYGYANLILTDYVEFRFYRNGLPYEEPVKIAKFNIKERTIKTLPDNFEHLNKSILDFTQTHKEPIKSAEHLSKIMGGKAQRIRDNVRYFLSTDSEKNKSLLRLYETIKKMLVHDLTHNTFADMYAQTLVYGLFVARYHDETPDNFTRQEARELVPKSNPLLRHFFDHILGLDYDERLKYIIDELCEVFSHADVPKLMKQYFKEDLWGKSHEGPDPVVHFYEDFLKEYDPELRKKMGAFYTPLPVVRFIVRSVDYLLEKEFGLSQGLADTSKSENGKHKVQILDPAAGTGTFITEIFKKIYSKFEGQKGRWPKYVFHDLLPRIHGFELMMAPYTIAHLKLSMLLKDTGFKHFNNARLGIYLTNSLEETELNDTLFTGIGFAESIAQESKDAAIIKNDTPIMVVIGNPPYSISSSNKSDWILNLIKSYKKDLNEQKINLDDDYIKFIRFAEHFIEKNKNGIVAMITNNSFVDGITHRQMRKHLLETFDDIYILDLHGNTNKKEKAPDGSKDENVFDIQQGVSINIFVKKQNNSIIKANVYHLEMFGTREFKFKKLDESIIKNIKWEKTEYTEPHYFFNPKDFSAKKDHSSGFKIDEIMPFFNSGIQTKNDLLAVSTNKSYLEKVINDFCVNEINELKILYPQRKESSGWNFFNAKKDILNGYTIVKYNYRPLDFRFLVYTGRSSGYIGRSRNESSKHFLRKNLGLAIMKQVFQHTNYSHVLVTDSMIDERTNYSNRGGTFLFPLYTYTEFGEKSPNINKEIVKVIEKTVGKTSPEDILDYIYAVLYSPTYREKYKEFLKIDFPRIPYPKDKKGFNELVKFGNELRLLHLMESPKVNKFITTFPEEGDELVEKITYKNGKVFINSVQYFGNVPEQAWNFYIGGYQPAQKWLKNRKGRTLTNEDIEHYQKIIVVLVETDRIMREIDKIKII